LAWRPTKTLKLLLSNRIWSAFLFLSLSIPLARGQAVNPLGSSHLAETLFTMPSGTIATLNEDGDASGYSATITGYGGTYAVGNNWGNAFKGAYDPFHDRIIYQGGAHNSGGQNDKLGVTYDVATNTWNLISKCTVPLPFGTGNASFQCPGWFQDRLDYQPQWTDLATSGAGSTTITTATGTWPFNGGLFGPGNIVYISAGTNFVTGSYTVSSITNATTMVLTTSPTPSGAGASGTGKTSPVPGNVHAYSLNGFDPVAKKWLRGYTNDVIYACDADYDDPLDIGANCLDSVPTPSAVYPQPGGSGTFGTIEWFPERNSTLFMDTGGTRIRELIGGESTFGTVVTDSAIISSLGGIYMGYNPGCHCVIYGGGPSVGVGSYRSWWKYTVGTSAVAGGGTITQLDDAPLRIFFDIPDAAYPLPDPITGKTLFLFPNASSGATAWLVYELDPNAGTGSQWTNRTDLGTYFTTTIAFTPGLAAFDTNYTIVTHLPEYGATIFAGAFDAFVWKSEGVHPGETGTVSAVYGELTPSLEDEKNTYRRWGWTWDATKETSIYPAADPCTLACTPYDVTAFDPNIDGSSENDDLFTYLIQSRRSGNSVFLGRAESWAEYFRDEYPTCVAGGGSANCDNSGNGYDHLYGWGLLAMYDHTGDSAYLTAAQTLADNTIVPFWSTPGGPCGFNEACMAFGLRAAGRQLLFATKLADKDSSYEALRDQMIEDIVTAAEWDPPYSLGLNFPFFVGASSLLTNTIMGTWCDLSTPSAGSTTLNTTSLNNASAGICPIDMAGHGGQKFQPWLAGLTLHIDGGTNFVPGDYLVTAWNSATSVTLATSPTPAGAGSEGSTANAGVDAYEQDSRIQAAFQVGILSEAMFQAYLSTGDTRLKTRLIQLADVVDDFAMDPTYDYTCGFFGPVQNGAGQFCDFARENPITHWEAAHTLDLVGTLAIAYKLTGTQNYLDRAAHFYDRGSKGQDESNAVVPPSGRCSGATVVCNFADTTFSSSGGNFYLAWNKGSLFYTRYLFENDGDPFVLSDATTPTLSSVSPDSGAQSTTVNVTLTGTLLDVAYMGGDALITVSGSGVTVTNEVVVGSTSITADFVISGAAATTARNVTVTTDDGTSGSQTFTVTAGGTVTPPTIITANIASSTFTGDPITLSVDAGGANGLIVHVMQHGAGNVSAPSTVTYDGVSMTRVCQDSYDPADTDYNNSSQWFLLNPTGSGAHNVVIDRVNGQTVVGTAVAVPIDGVNSTTPYGTCAIANSGFAPVSAADSITVTVTADSGALVVDTVSGISGTSTVSTLTVGAGQTQDAQLDILLTSTHLTGATSHQTGAASSVMSWSPDRSTYFSIVGVPYNGIEASGGGFPGSLLSDGGLVGARGIVGK
jgi:hypothetical protein